MGKRVGVTAWLGLCRLTGAVLEGRLSTILPKDVGRVHIRLIKALLHGFNLLPHGAEVVLLRDVNDPVLLLADDGPLSLCPGI